ncbi:mCG1031067, isoform CRA_d [Mus musculus]|nr:mCG1031067, isoform CRA_d [Mus musculus]EDL14103.1 mCG1031067, isoform CRA_d [Mus musculus]
MEEYGLLAHLSRCSTWLLQLPCLLPATSTLSWNCKPK